MILYSLLRDSSFGQLVNYLTNGRCFRALWEDCEIPENYLEPNCTESSDGKQVPKPMEKCKSKTERDSKEDGMERDSYIVVGWEEFDATENPRNWPLPKKCFVIMLMAVLTLALYIASAVFTPSEQQMLAYFDTSRVKLMLGLSLFVWGYGLSPLWFCPMSENPFFRGRNHIYIVTLFLFAIIQIPTALINHVAPFVVLRLLAGMLASPPLATTAATYHDIVDFPYLVYALLCWDLAAMQGPFVGPLIGAALVNHNSWRWTFWFLLIESGAMFLIVFFLLPETSSQELLMRKAKILRRRTGNQNIVASGELIMHNQSIRELLKEIFWYPIEITFKEVVLFLIDIYTSLIYAMMYLFFESFPISYMEVYEFNLVQMGLAYLAPLIGCFLLIGLYAIYLQKSLIEPLSRSGSFSPDKVFGNAAIVGTLLFPFGILIYGWSSTGTVHWIVSMVGTLLFGMGAVLSFQSYMAYLGYLYPTKFASASGSNAIMRSFIGGSFPLFGTVMYRHTSIPNFPVGWGCTIISLSSLAMLPLPIYIRIKGKQLRERSKEKYGDALIC